MARSKQFLAALAAASTVLPGIHAAYTLIDSFSGASFFDTMDFFTEADPTNGTVTYVDFETATSNRLIGLVAPSSSSRTSSDSNSSATSSESVYIGVDHSSITTAFRPSIRISTQQSWTHGLLLADIASAPTGCGTWPALWLVNTAGTWPGNTGEIDLFETVNNAVANSMTLHTSAGCALNTSSEAFSGTMSTSNCDVNAPNQAQNAGCSIQAPQQDTIVYDGETCSYATAGPAFNAAGGGVYAMEWTSSSISISFHPRGYIPSDIVSGTPNPSSWTNKPIAVFEGCAFDGFVKELSLVVNIALCGDWAGEVWQSGGCAAETGTSTCEEYVAANPHKFDTAYWVINGVSMWQEG